MSTLERRIADSIAADDPRADRAELGDRVAQIAADAEALGISRRDVVRRLARWNNRFPERRHLWLTADSALADLRRTVVEQDTTQRERAWYWLAAAPGWIIDHYIAVAGIAVAIATTFYGFAYSSFFRALDTTPEEVGLTPTQILTHSAVGGVTLTLATAVAFYCAIIPIIPIRDDPKASTDKGRGLHLLVNLLCTLAGVAVLAIIFMWMRIPPPLATLAIFPIVVIFLIANVRLRLRRGMRVGLRPLNFSLERYIIVAALMIPAGLLLTAGITVVLAHDLGSVARRGDAVSNPTILGVPFLNVRAEPALIDWAEGNRPRRRILPHCALYLGASNDDSVFYDHRAHRTFHVPSSAASIDLRTDMESCEAPTNASLPTIHVRSGSLECVPGRWHTAVEPNFKYEWLSDGVPIADDDGPPARSLEPNDWRGLPIRCRVTATTTFGSDRAVSSRILVPAWVAEAGLG